jgi:hypothetical protein
LTVGAAAIAIAGLLSLGTVVALHPDAGMVTVQPLPVGVGIAIQPAPSPFNLPSPGASGSGSASPSVSPRVSGSLGTPTAGQTPKPGQPAGPPDKPPPAGWPNASNTGVPKGTSLKATGSVTVTKDGAVISGLDVHGTVNIEANNVVIKDVSVTNSGYTDWGIIQRSGASGLLIEDSTIAGNGSQEMQQAVLNEGGGLTVRRTNISRISDGIASNQGTFEDNYLHDPKVFSGDHTDMFQATAGPPSGKTLVIRHNTLINTASQTSAIGLYQDFGVDHDTLVEYNYLAGGGYTVYGGDGEKGTPTNMKFQHNTFGRDVFSKGGYWGPVAHYNRSGSGNVWSDNVWAGTGASVSA